MEENKQNENFKIFYKKLEEEDKKKFNDVLERINIREKYELLAKRSKMWFERRNND